MTSEIQKLKGALAHVDQATINIKGPTATAKRIIDGVIMLLGEAVDLSGVTGRNTLARLNAAKVKYDGAIAELEAASRELKDGIARVNRI